MSNILDPVLRQLVWQTNASAFFVTDGKKQPKLRESDVDRVLRLAEALPERERCFLLRRLLPYRVEPCKLGGYRVTSPLGDEYWVRDGVCTCAGFANRAECKHLSMVEAYE